MAELTDKVQNALDEARMLILGSEVLLGFQFRAPLEAGFEKLPHDTQLLKLAGLVLMVFTTGLLLSPGAYHQLVEEGRDTAQLHRFTTRIMSVALLPFALGLGIDVFVAAEKTLNTAVGIAAGIVATLFALTFWYGIEAVRRSEHGHAKEEEERRSMSEAKQNSRSSETKLKDEIKQVLTEARVALPGAQALLGFQFATILMEAFSKLPRSSQILHLASLGLIA